MPAPFNPLAVANRFLGLSFKEGRPLDPLKLQKLLYFAHGWNLAINDQPLIAGDIQAWKYGPVVGSVYQAFRHFGSQPITSFARLFLVEDGKLVSKEAPPVPDGDPAAELIDAIYEEYGKYDGVQLFKMTHAPGTAWQLTHEAHNGQLPAFAAIPTELIKSEFKAKLDKVETA